VLEVRSLISKVGNDGNIKITACDTHIPTKDKALY